MDAELTREMRNMKIIARAREGVRNMLKRSGRLLPEGEHFRLGALAMATLGQPDEINGQLNSCGEPVKVGPYTSQAVNYVLHGKEHSEEDRQLVLQYAMLINMARRI